MQVQLLVRWHGTYAYKTTQTWLKGTWKEGTCVDGTFTDRYGNTYAGSFSGDGCSVGYVAGGTFTISNGGIFGSMMSTPILNPPQTGVLGMHNIQDRAVVVDGEIVVRPMMYLALSYDHRLIDGREAVQFLVAIKGMIEDPARILLEL